MNFLVLLIGSLTLLCACAAIGDSDEAETGGWSTVASLHEARMFHTASTLPDGRVVVVGGFTSRDGPDQILASIEVFDPAAAAWAPGEPMPVARFGHEAAVLHDGRVLVAGGHEPLPEPNVSIVSRSAWIYDPDADAWSAAPDMLREHSDGTATVLPDGRVLVVENGAELYDPVAAVWKPSPPPVQFGIFHTATLLQDGRVLIVGGGRSERRAAIFQPGDGSWREVRSSAEPRFRHTATLLDDGRVLLVGGDLSGGRGVAKTELFDPRTETWQPAGEVPTTRHSSTRLASGRVLVVGGVDLTQVVVFDPESAEWSTVASLSEYRYQHTASILTDGSVIVVGGLRAGVPSDSVERFEPEH